jgi:metal-responsive CopG/Arc/MetJ family transcriptional regulator
MTNMTISIPSELCEKMKKHAEVKWSEVVRKSIADYINKMEMVNGGVVPSSILVAMLKDSNLDLSNITLEKATEQYEKSSDLEWKRLSTTQTSS